MADPGTLLDVPGSSWVGTVVEYAAEVGFGIAESDSGSRRGFHCIAIADGTRQIAVGTRVACRVVPGATGQWELAAVAPVVD